MARTVYLVTSGDVATPVRPPALKRRKKLDQQTFVTTTKEWKDCWADNFDAKSKS